MNPEMTTLGESCHFFNGKAHEKNIDAEGSFVVVNSRFISTDGRVQKFTGEQKFPLFENDIVLVMSDVPNGKALAKCHIIEENDKYSLNQRICAIRTEEFDIRFLYYQLNRNPYLLAFNNGENQTNLRKGDILKTPLWKPSLEIQKQIVTLLDSAFAKIDQCRANIEKNIANAKELFQSKLNEIFSQKGDGWEEKTLGEVGKVSMCKRILKKQTNTEIGIPFYKIGTFGKKANAYISKEIYEEFKSKYSFPKKGDVLISASGTIGRRVIYDGLPAYFQDSNIVWIDNNEDCVLNEYLYQFYGICDWNPSRGATISRLYNDDLRRIKISFPNKIKQKELIETMIQLSKQTKNLEISFQQKLQNLEDLKKSLLQKAFAGELTSPEGTPDKKGGSIPSETNPTKPSPERAI